MFRNISLLTVVALTVSSAGWADTTVARPTRPGSEKLTIDPQALRRLKPDLVVQSARVVKWGECEPYSAVMTWQVTILNKGATPSPSSASLGNKALVQVLEKNGAGPWGNGAMLPTIAPGKTATVLVPVYYFQANPAHMTADAPHSFAAIADPLKLVSESNENNNKLSPIKTVAPRGCLSVEIPGGKNPDLGIYGGLRIGENKKPVQWGQTIVLTPADADSISNGKPAFDIYYGYRELNNVPVPGPFKNRLFFKGQLVSLNSNLSAGPQQIKPIHTQAYMGPQDGRLSIKIDADNEVSESNEGNNGPFWVYVKFSGF